MKVDANWYRVAGVHVEKNADIAVVWVAHDRQSDTVHLYDSALFRREVLAVIAEGIKARGAWVPLSWEANSEDMLNQLKDRGCKILFEGYKDTPEISELHSRDIWERMRTGRFKVDRRNAEWLDEYRGFYRDDGQVPQTNFPLMSATRHAINGLEKGRQYEPPKRPIQYDNRGYV